VGNFLSNATHIISQNILSREKYHLWATALPYLLHLEGKESTKSDFGGKLEAFDKNFNFLEDSGLLLLSSHVASQRNLN